MLWAGEAGAQARDIEAGPIWNNEHAQQVCPQICQGAGLTFQGAWRTTVQGRMSVCGCAPPPGAMMPPPGQPMYGQPGQPMYGQPGQPMQPPPGQPMYGQPGQPMQPPPGQPMYGQPGQPMYGQPGQPMQPQPGYPPGGYPGPGPGAPQPGFGPPPGAGPMGGACRWADGMDGSFQQDPGRGVSDWQQHFQYAMGPQSRQQIPLLVSGRLDVLRGCLNPQEFARLYAEVSVLTAYYGRVFAGWQNAMDNRSAQDQGRGVNAWQAHYDFAQDRRSATMASGFLRQRLTDLAGLPPDAYARLYADLSTRIAGFARAR